MNWEMLSAIGQVVAAIGVIPSLIYLAVQIRDQNKERRRAGINILTTQWGELVKTGQESRKFAEVFLRGMQSFQGLDAPDKLRFSAFFTRFTRNAEGMFIYYRDGALEKALWEEVERTMNDYFAYPGVREWWATRKHWLTDEFRAVVEPIIAKNLEPKMYAAYGLDEASKKVERRKLFRFPVAVKRDPAIEGWMDKHADELGAIARRWFEVMRGCGDDARELLHDGHPTACLGDVAFAYVNAFKVHVNVGFFRGGELADPKALLEGTGKFMRHVKLSPEREVDTAALTKLIQSAYFDMKNRLEAE